MKQAAGQPVTFRTLDIGGDKVVPYFRAAEEENPALGWRAIRLSLDRPGLLRTQLRALLRASAGAELKMMMPMVTEVVGAAQVRELLQKEVQQHVEDRPAIAEASCSSAPCSRCRRCSGSSTS